MSESTKKPAMKHNLVLIQPHIGDMDMFRKHPSPPIGLLCAASVIAGEMEIRIVDQRTDKDWRGLLAKSLDAGTVAVGVTAMTGEMILSALKAAGEVRRLSRAPIIWGGMHASLMPAQTVSHELADYVVEGEGEAALAELARRLAAGADTGGIPGVWRKVNGKPEGAPRAALLDMDALPRVPYHLLDMEKYIQLYNGGKRTIFYQSSRGCPNRCTYCYNMTFNAGRWRAKNAAQVISEISELKERYRLDAVFIWDDNFFIDRDRAMKIVAGVKGLGLRCLLHGADVESLERMSDADLDFLESAGVDALALGVESASDRVRAEVLKKRGSIALVRSQLARFRGRSIELSCFFILGLPTETLAEMKQSIAFALETMRMGRNFHMERFFNFTPYPGTELLSELLRQGIRFPEKLEDWGAYHWDYSHLYGSQPETRFFLERISRISKFLDRIKDPFVQLDWIPTIIFFLYRPIAWARIDNGWLRFMPEFWVGDKMMKRAKKRIDNGWLRFMPEFVSRQYVKITHK